MKMNKKRVCTMLVLVWGLMLLLTLAFRVDPPVTQSEGPDQVYGDACLNNCYPCDLIWKPEPPIHFYDACCTWDYGCWLNPFEPDYQIGPCERWILYCVNRPPGEESPTVSLCCSTHGECWEHDGQPCCEPQGNWPCPD